MTHILTQLGHISVEQFMSQYWQKKPLLIRQAFPTLQDDSHPLRLSPQQLFDLAAQDDVESRLITHFRKRWEVAHGPFEIDELPETRQKNWTLLVQGVNLHNPQIAALMRAFRFVSDTRLDDVMISYATDGGGVGPHFDSYDVFLLQARGQRHWQISAQKNQTLRDDVPLKILADFVCEEEWTLEPGDMLYLPPHYAHNGIAKGECMTYSVGFRAPGLSMLSQRFLEFFAEHLEAITDQDRTYKNKDESLTKTPAKLPQTMIDTVSKQLRRTRWNKDLIEQFLGQFNSEPKSNVFFDPPAKTMSLVQFVKTLSRQGCHLHDKSLLLYRGQRFYINGEPIISSAPYFTRALKQLANERHLPALQFAQAVDIEPTADQALLELLYDWYCAGWLSCGSLLQLDLP